MGGPQPQKFSSIDTHTHTGFGLRVFFCTSVCVLPLQTSVTRGHWQCVKQGRVRMRTACVSRLRRTVFIARCGQRNIVKPRLNSPQVSSQCANACACVSVCVWLSESHAKLSHSCLLNLESYFHSFGHHSYRRRLPPSFSLISWDLPRNTNSHMLIQVLNKCLAKLIRKSKQRRLNNYTNRLL